MKLAVVSESDSTSLQIVEPEPQAVEVSVVMPCLNEAETLETCILKAQKAPQVCNVIFDAHFSSACLGCPR